MDMHVVKTEYNILSTTVAVSCPDDYIYYINKDNRSLCKQFRYVHNGLIRPECTIKFQNTITCLWSHK